MSKILKKTLSIILAILMIVGTMLFAFAAKSYEITHQPTADEPYVELSDAEGASYQWYIVEGGEKNAEELTDKHDRITIPSVDDLLGNPTPDHSGAMLYDSETGWSPVCLKDDNRYGMYYFLVDLEAGETISCELSEVPLRVSVSDIEHGSAYITAMNGRKGSFTATIDSTYLFCVLGDKIITARAYLSKGEEFVKVEGETGARLEDITARKKYACEVTYSDGSIEMSNIFEYTLDTTDEPSISPEDCECLCHKDGFFGAILAFLVKLFSRIFNVDRICECGISH